MFNRALNLILENEKVEVYEKKTTVKPSGGTSIQWVKLGTILCNIQADYRCGEVLANSQAGDSVREIQNLYTRSKIKNGQRIKRIEEDGLFYEIRHAEHNGRKTILEHYKGYLERVTQ